MKESEKARHPIRVVAQRTGLTPATIRAWERRYDAVTPTRSEGGQRVYSDVDVERLSTLKALADAGRGISMVAALSPADAEALLTEDLSTRILSDSSGLSVPPSGLDEAYRCVRALDGEGLEKSLWRALVVHGARPFLSQVAGRLMQRIGEDWVGGEITPAQEHLASEVLERIGLRSAWCDESTRWPARPRWRIFARRLILASFSSLVAEAWPRFPRFSCLRG